MILVFVDETRRNVSEGCEIGEQGSFQSVVESPLLSSLNANGDCASTRVGKCFNQRTNSSPEKKGVSPKYLVWIRKVVTWLILPVVICLSQRLSHACLSINNFVLWNCEWLIKSVIVYLMVSYYMDNCGNSRANTCNQAPTSGRGVFIR